MPPRHQFQSQRDELSSRYPSLTTPSSYRSARGLLPCSDRDRDLAKSTRFLTMTGTLRRLTLRKALQLMPCHGHTWPDLIYNEKDASEENLRDNLNSRNISNQNDASKARVPELRPTLVAVPCCHALTHTTLTPHARPAARATATAGSLSLTRLGTYRTKPGAACHAARNHLGSWPVSWTWRSQRSAAVHGTPGFGRGSGVAAG